MAAEEDASAGKSRFRFSLDTVRDFFYWRGETSQVVLYPLLCVALCWLVTKLCRRRSKSGLQVGDPHRGHRWHHTDFLDKPTYCNWCKVSLVRGSFCDTCGLSVHDECLDAANKKHACKVVVLSKRATMRHHWVRGNLPLTSICNVCGTHCGTEPRLCDLRCVWCHRTVHENCIRVISRDCDLGKYQRMIVPPYSITVKYERWKGAFRRYMVREVDPPKFKNWSPLLVLANRKSGENEGERLLRAFRKRLNPIQVARIKQDLIDIRCCSK